MPWTRLWNESWTAQKSPATTSPLLFLSQLSTRFAREYKPLRETIHHWTSGKPSSPIIHTLDTSTEESSATFSSRQQDTRNHRRSRNQTTSLSHSLPYQTVVPNYKSWLITSADHLSYFRVNPTIFDVSHGFLVVICPLLHRKKEVREARSRFKRGSMRQTRGMSLLVKLERRSSDLCKGRYSVPFTKKAIR